MKNTRKIVFFCLALRKLETSEKTGDEKQANEFCHKNREAANCEQRQMPYHLKIY